MAPLAALSAALVLALAASASAQTQRLSFKEIPAATSIEYVLRTTNEVTIDNVTYAIQYKPLLESGKTYTGFDGNPWPVGQVLDKFGVPLTTSDSASADPALARDFDKSSVFAKFGQTWMVTHNEDSWGMFFLSQLSQNASTGELTVAKAKSLNVAAIYGAIRPCSGSLTPWKSHLAGLETVQESKGFPPASTVSAFVSQALYMRLPTWRDVSPYWTGFFVEVQVTSAAGDYSMAKHYAMGRAPWETGVVLADQRTVICSDDTGSGGIMTMFIADKPADLSCGRLYSSKPTQLNAADGGSFKMEWVALTNGSVCDSFVASYVEKAGGFNDSIKFPDIFDYMTPVLVSGVPDLTQKPADYREVKSLGSRYEWLRLKPGMQNLAAVLETERMSSYMGGCTEWTKLEGVSYDWRTKEVYFAITAIQSSMLDDPTGTDLGGSNYIRLPQNVPGAVYKMKTAAVPGLSGYTPITARAVVNSYGGNSAPSTAGAFSIPSGSIANPDNVDIMSRYKTLMISEDTDSKYHPNNFFWAFNTETGSITRIMSVPYEAEVTSGYYYPNVGSFSYLTATVQHPRTQDMPCTMGYWTLPRENF